MESFWCWGRPHLVSPSHKRCLAGRWPREAVLTTLTQRALLVMGSRVASTRWHWWPLCPSSLLCSSSALLLCTSTSQREGESFTSFQSFSEKRWQPLDCIGKGKQTNIIRVVASWSGSVENALDNVLSYCFPSFVCVSLGSFNKFKFKDLLSIKHYIKWKFSFRHRCCDW